jgi:hypothetical protein
MAVEWTVIAKVIEAAYDAYQNYNDRESILQRHQEIIDEIVGGLNRTRYEIITEIVQEIRDGRLANLDGDIRGLEIRFAEYARYDQETQHSQWQSEGNRLRDIIDDSADVLGNLEAELDHLDLRTIPDARHAGRVFALYAVLVPFRATAILERDFTYGTQGVKHIPAMFDKIKALAGTLSARLRAASDSRFSSDIVERRGEPLGDGQYSTILGYMFENVFTHATVIVFGRHVSRMRELARDQLNAHKERAFLQFPGVSVILTVLEETDEIAGVYELNLVSILCVRTEERSGTDETYLTVRGRRIWGPVSMADSDEERLAQVSKVRFRDRIAIDLYEQDSHLSSRDDRRGRPYPRISRVGLDQDDHLGTTYARDSQGGIGEQKHDFTGHGAHYTLTYKVTKV